VRKRDILRRVEERRGDGRRENEEEKKEERERDNDREKKEVRQREIETSQIKANFK